MNRAMSYLPCQTRRYLSAGAGAAVVFMKQEAMFPQFLPEVHFAAAGLAAEVVSKSNASMAQPGLEDSLCSMLYGLAGGYAMRYMMNMKK